MKRSFCIESAVLAFAAACTSTRPEDPSLALAREMVAVERRAPEPPRRLRLESEPPRVDPSAVAFISTGPRLTATYAVRDGGREQRYVLTRAESCIHLASELDEWRFERNPVAPEHVLGLRADHRQQVLIEYPFSDLCAEGWVSSWSSLARLGLTPAELGSLSATGNLVERLGLRFEELRASAARGDEIQEVLWNEQHQIPARIVRASGFEVELLGLSLEVDQERLGRLERRVAEYTRYDVSDWREALHERGHAHH